MLSHLSNLKCLKSCLLFCIYDFQFYFEKCKGQSIFEQDNRHIFVVKKSHSRWSLWHEIWTNEVNVFSFLKTDPSSSFARCSSWHVILISFYVSLGKMEILNIQKKVSHFSHLHFFVQSLHKKYLNIKPFFTFRCDK